MPGQNLFSHFSSSIDFIHSAGKQGGNILVHCYAGISRSTTMVIAYLMQTKGMNFTTAFRFVKK